MKTLNQLDQVKWTLDGMSKAETPDRFNWILVEDLRQSALEDAVEEHQRAEIEPDDNGQITSAEASTIDWHVARLNYIKEKFNITNEEIKKALEEREKND